MNKDMYRLVWNRSLGALQVVSEMAKSKACGGSVTVSGPGARARGKTAAWPLGLLTLAIGSSALATPGPNVTNGADAGAGSLRDQLANGGSVYIDPAVNTITLTSDLSVFGGDVTRIEASGPLSITGGRLVGGGQPLELTGVSNGTLSTAISGQFEGEAQPIGGSASNGSDGAAGTPTEPGKNGESGSYTAAPADGIAAISGSHFAIDSTALIIGGAGAGSVAPGNGGNGGAGSNSLGPAYGGEGGNGGNGSSGSVGSTGGAGISGSYFSVTNNHDVYGGNGTDGVKGGNGGRGGEGGSATYLDSYGGNGGDGGSGGNGGNGGVGITGSDINIVNNGTIQGGNGGRAGLGGTGGGRGYGAVGSMDGEPGVHGSAGAAGAGGVGLVATGNSTIRNAGTVAGGKANGGAGAQANAIELSGGNNKLVLEQNSVITGKVVSTSGGSDVLALGGDSNVGANTFDLGSLGGQDSDKQYQGFGAFRKDGSSTWTLTGTDTYGKHWAVNGGTLAMANGSSLLGSVSILGGSTLRAGNASIGKDVSNAGLLVVGNTASPYEGLEIGGTYAQASTGTLRISALNDLTYSYLSVRGDVLLDGKLDVDVKNGNAFDLGQVLSHVISTDTGTITGQFSAVTDNSLLFNFTPTYDGKKVSLKVVADSGGSSGGRNTISGHVQALGNSPARGAAQVLDSVIASNTTGRMAGYFIPLTSAEEVSRAASETLPMASGSMVAARTALTSINGVVQGRSEQVRGLSSGDVAFTDQHLWIKPFGSWADQESRGAVPGVNTSVGGLAFGLDASLNERWMLGTAFVYANADTRNTGDSARQSLKTDVYQLVGYGTYHLDGSTDLNFQIDGGQNHNEGKRDIDFAKLKAKSNYDSWTAHAGVSLDHTISLSTATRFTPSVRADYTWIKDEAYIEKGAEDLSLKTKSRTTDQFILGVDGKLSHDLSQQLNVSGNLGVGYDFLADKDSITSSFAGAPGASFTAYGGDAQRWLVRGGTGLTYKVSDRVEVGVRYDLEKRSDYLNQTASVEARWAF